MKRRLLIYLLLTFPILTYGQDQGSRPNILFCISDDQSFPHASAYGTDWVHTPGFDRVAREGILFMNAYTPNAKCAPSRSCIITGRNSWQLEEAANHVPFFPAKFKTYVEALKDAGYHTGHTGKGWAPGDPGIKDGQKRELVGSKFSHRKSLPPAKYISGIDYSANFEAFLDSNLNNQPFCFWYGGHEPHRRYEYGVGITKTDKKLTDINRVFNFWPDNDSVRTDLLDYAFEIEYFDQHLVRMLHLLEQKGQLENTIVIVTSDNGMPFPGVKGQSYEYSNHLPLAIMWKAGIKKPGRIYEPFVSFTDFAPTFLDLANLSILESGMQAVEGTSLKPVFENRIDPNLREFMIIGKERHDLGRPGDVGYPIRGILEGNFLFLMNYETDRWPAGNPETGYMNCDGSPTKTYILNERRRMISNSYWKWNFGKRENEQLFNIMEDPDCIDNLAQNREYFAIKNRMNNKLIEELLAEGDPRANGHGAVFDSYSYAQKKQRRFYERFMAGEDIKAGWINQTDIEPKAFLPESVTPTNKK